MIVEVALGLATLTAVAVLFWLVWWPLPHRSQIEPDVAVPVPAIPRTERRDILAEFAHELTFTALTAEGAAEHRLALLEAMLREAEHETIRMELLVDRLGQKMSRRAA